jgi:hypothetical protein
MWTAAKRAGLAIDAIEKADIHGVSYVFRMRLASTLDVSQHPLYLHEQRIGLYGDLMYYVYVEKIRALQEWIRERVADLEKQGIPLVGYGAAAKGMTILNYVGSIPMAYIADDSPKKWGYYATNTKYPIVEPSKLAETPEKMAVVVFAWNFLEEIKRKIGSIRQGKETVLIVPYPRKAIYMISKEGKVYPVFEEVDTRYNADSLHHKTILLTHFYNEEILLTQWIRHHAPLFDCAVLIDHNSTDNSRKVIAREAPATWNVVSSYLPEFDAQETDREVAGYENSFNNTDWRLALTTTEFLYTSGLRRKANTVFEGLNGKRAIQIQSISFIDKEEESRVDPTLPILQQKHVFYYNPISDEEQFINKHYNRFMHCVREFTNPYWLGRHNFKHPAKRSNLHIVKWLFSPYPEFFARKLQIMAKIPESNKQMGWGKQHIVDMPGLCSRYERLKQYPSVDITDVEGQKEYYDREMRDEGEPDGAMLCGNHMNLYGESIVL